MKSFAEGIYNNRKLLATLVTVLALMVAIGTTYTLISPASTMEAPVEEQILETSGQTEDAELSVEEQAEVDSEETLPSDEIAALDEPTAIDEDVDAELQPADEEVSVSPNQTTGDATDVSMKSAKSQPQFSTINSADTSQFITMNVYNYGSNINDPYYDDPNYPGYQHPGARDSITSLGPYDFNFGDIVTADIGDPNITKKGGSNINATTNDYTANMPISGIMSPTLNADGYPHIKVGNVSMKYLFSQSDYATKLNESNVNGLFQYDAGTGAYYFNSMNNHAQYDYSADNFVLYNQLITSNAFMYPFGNFLPLNNIEMQTTRAVDINSANMQAIAASAKEKYTETTESRYNKVSTVLKQFDAQMKTVDKSWDYEDALSKYISNVVNYAEKKAAYPKYGTDYIPRLYNIDFDEKTDFFFGMDMSMQFMQPKGGLTGLDGKQPMIYDFTGDDDVLVYIDNILFLDLSGIHRHVGGKIDFVEGKVYYYRLEPFIGTIGPMATKPYKTVTFEQILGSKSGLNEKGTFKDYSMHKFNFYYMERGSGSSVCRLNFNFPLLKKNTISVEKAVTSDVASLGNPDFSFQILKADGNGNKTEELFIAADTEYKLYDSNNTLLETRKVGTNGVLKIKAGQRAEFEGINENSGKYYVRELFEDGFKEQYDSITVSGESTTFVDDITVGTDKFEGVDSPVKDCSDGATNFRFDNSIDELKLGGLQISKTVTDYNNNPTEEAFEFNILLDGEKLATGTKYAVTKAGVTRTEAVNTPGIIELTHGETAVISNIKAGTHFQVTEVGETADSYSTTYELEGQALGGTVPAGFIKPATNTSVAVTNDEYGTSINIPVTKTVTNANGSEKTFTFRIQEVDAEGNAVEGGHSAENVLKMEGDRGTFEFPLTYRASKQKVREKTYYYKITEVSDGNDKFIYDPSAYIAEVKVIKENKQLSVAEPVKIYKIETDQWTEVDRITFNNEQLYSLEVAKSVTGREDDNTQFSFTISLNGNDTKVFNFEKFSGAELIDSGVIDFSNGSVDIELQDTQKYIIHGLPAGVEWTISEKGTLSDGYIAKYKVNDGQQFTRGLSATDTIAPENVINGVTFENEVCYTLPETGGIGTKPFYIGGLLLIAVAGVLLMRQRKREV